MKKDRVNDFVVRFANVNGTGSASANALVAKAFFRMGLSVGPKNMFPSNIQGFPTWYEIRVSHKGYTGRRGGVDLLVAMNPQSFAKDEASVDASGYLIYDEARIFTTTPRKDIEYIPLPLTRLSQEFEGASLRSMMKNMIYVGALAVLLDIEMEVLETLVREAYGDKPKVLEANRRALYLGSQALGEKYKKGLPMRVKRLLPKSQKIMLEGNEALGFGAVCAGATVAGWYPITPSTSVVDAFSRYCEAYRVVSKDGKKERRYAVLQAEDEIAAIGMVLGASWNGARAFTATSGPGISLMSEFLGYAYYAEIPAVLFNIQRVGPSTGMPTRTQQADLLLCAYASHGDTKHILLFPGTPKECFEFSQLSFDLADRIQSPVICMSDLELGMNEFMSEPLVIEEGYRPDRGKILDEKDLEELKEPFHRYMDHDGDGICYRTLPFTHKEKGANLTRGSGHDRFGRYTEDGGLYQDNMDRLSSKFETAKSFLPEGLLTLRAEGSPLGLIYLGVLCEPVLEALDILEEEGILIDALRVRAFPFKPSVRSFVLERKKVLVLDQNRDGQLRSLLLLEEGFRAQDLISVKTYDGLPATALSLCGLFRKALEGVTL